MEKKDALSAISTKDFYESMWDDVSVPRKKRRAAATVLRLEEHQQ
jgi:hypothetical protein